MWFYILRPLGVDPLFLAVLSIQLLFGSQLFSTERAIAIFEGDTDSAIEYNDNMIGIQSQVDIFLVDFLDAIDTGKDYNMKGARKECLKEIKIAKKKKKKLGKYNDSDAYQKQMLQFLEMYTDIVKVELTEISKTTPMLESLSDEESVEYYAYYDSALSKYDKAFQEFNTFQKVFSDKWDFSVEVSE